MPIIICKICGIEAKVKRSNRETCGSKICSYSLRSKRKAETKEKTEGIQKQCETCFEFFIDVTRRQSSKNCLICIKSNMVLTRRENDSYSQSEETKLKKSNSMKKKYEEGWNPNTDDHKKKLSFLMKLRWASEKMRRKIHWTQTPEGKLNLSKIHTGKKVSNLSRIKMSFAASKRIVSRKSKNFWGRGGVREDLGFYVRSTWEANFARILKFEKKHFEYENETFLLSNGKTYTPDFKVDEVFYEIKGYMTETARDKIDLFRKEYPEKVLQIIGAQDYNKLYIKYATTIKWEKT